jgi:hypothetical protein
VSNPIVVSCILTATVTRGRFVRINSASGGLPVATQSTDGTLVTGHHNVGVALTSGVSGDIIDVQIAGLCHVVTASGSLTLGVLVTTDASGKAKAAAAGDVARGILISGKDSDASTADTEDCVVLLGIYASVV